VTVMADAMREREGAREADGWWEGRAYASLRAVNALRLQILDDWLSHWFAGAGPRRIVDLGCGGGLMALPLARRGAHVVAVDRSLPALREGVRQQHALRAPARGGVQFVHGDLLAPPIDAGSADLVLLCDVLEHVDEPAQAICAAARLLRPGGRLFVNTINRTLRARVLAVWLGEGLGLIPRGTHSADRFVRPDELKTMAHAADLRATDWCGERPALLASLRRRTVAVRPHASLAVGYSAGFTKEER